MENIFLDRTDAGQKLGKALIQYKGQSAVVYALPRGGVVLGVEVARDLDAPLDLIVVRKIGHPFQPEYATGAVAEDGYIVRSPADVGTVDEHWFELAAARELKEARRRRALFFQGRQPVSVENKIAIIVDDGLATGLTMLAAIHEVKKRRPRKIVVAVPVGAAQTVEQLRDEVDDLIVLHVSYALGAIGAFYENFDQVSDHDVMTLMKSTSPVHQQ